MRFIITRYVGRAGVNLSRPGNWGNLPFADDQAATDAAHQLAGKGPIAIERETVRPRSIVR